jgi:hypothetical protein
VACLAPATHCWLVECVVQFVVRGRNAEQRGSWVA